MELIWHVDGNDNPIGQIERDESRRTGARYRMVRIIVESPDGSQILLQKRLDSKKTFPSCWDTSAGGNIAYGESYEDAAVRELAEEIGLREVELVETGYFYSEAVDPQGNKMNRFTKLFRATASTTYPFVPQPIEVARIQWVSREELANIIREGNITDGLKQVYERYLEVI